MSDFAYSDLLPIAPDETSYRKLSDEGATVTEAAGSSKTPSGYASGSFGPTTAGRMDSYVEQFRAKPVTLTIGRR